MENNWLWAINRIDELKSGSGVPFLDISRMDGALKGLADKIKDHLETFNFRLFIIGYCGRNDGGRRLDFRKCA